MTAWLLGEGEHVDSEAERGARINCYVWLERRAGRAKAFDSLYRHSSMETEHRIYREEDLGAEKLGMTTTGYTLASFCLPSLDTTNGCFMAGCCHVCALYLRKVLQFVICKKNMPVESLEK